jgi:hypothetical protein
MAQVERIEDMEVGDHIVLPRGEWHLNAAAKAIYAQAQEITTAHTGDDAAPQYQVNYTSKYDSQLERIR